MVTNITSLSGNGLRDWLVQRITAIVLGLYLVVLFGFFVLHPHPSYYTWFSFYHGYCFRIINVMVMISLVKHAWIGLWTVSTDYLKCTVLRLGMQVLVGFTLFALLLWFLMMIWG